MLSSVIIMFSSARIRTPHIYNFAHYFFYVTKYFKMNVTYLSSLIFMIAELSEPYQHRDSFPINKLGKMYIYIYIYIYICARTNVQKHKREYIYIYI